MALIFAAIRRVVIIIINFKDYFRFYWHSSKAYLAGIKWPLVVDMP